MGTRAPTLHRPVPTKSALGKFHSIWPCKCSAAASRSPLSLFSARHCGFESAALPLVVFFCSPRVFIACNFRERQQQRSLRNRAGQDNPSCGGAHVGVRRVLAWHAKHVPCLRPASLSCSLPPRACHDDSVVFLRAWPIADGLNVQCT